MSMNPKLVKNNGSEPPRTPAVLVEHVFKSYVPWGPFKWTKSRSFKKDALLGVSLTVHPGETVGLLGPNGAGKTTLLKIIATLLAPTEGRVLINGMDPSSELKRVRQSMGLVTCDERSFYWRLSGRENLAFFATLYGVPKKEARERVEILLEATNLKEAADRPFHSYSSGMKQRLAFARGLLANPSIILYDEPTRSLDPLSTQNIRNWLVHYRASLPQTAHLIATNQLAEAELLCDRVLILNRGVIIAAGSIPEIHKAWRGREYAIHRITCRNFPWTDSLCADPEEGLLEVTEESRELDRRVLRLCTVENSEALSRALKFILQSGGVIVSCETEQVPFDDVFCSLVAGEAKAAAAEVTV
jgi:ABC-2 type transport system ATP-binding protein